MPSAAPVPRSPSILTLATADELLTRPGCPVCQYATEASDRYLTWFAAEAHADPVTITRLCESLGMCPRHTRALMRQPGAATRLTVLSRYLLQAAQGKLAGRVTKLADCPACEHDTAAAGRALDTILDGLATASVRQRYLELGGLCVPHVRDAAGVRGRRHAATWAVRARASTLGSQPDLDALAGAPRHDADERARLRAGLPPPGRIPPGCCLVCLAAAQAEARELAQAARDMARRPCGADVTALHRNRCLCAAHLRDAAIMEPAHAPAVLAAQGACLSAELAWWLSPGSIPWGRIPVGWLPGRSACRHDMAECLICRAKTEVARRTLHRCLPAPRTVPQGSDGPWLCVRHVLALRAAGSAAGRAAADVAVQRADTLLRELAEAFRKSTWAHRHEAPGPELSAWRRALVFLDGDVSGGCPPGER